MNTLVEPDDAAPSPADAPHALLANIVMCEPPGFANDGANCLRCGYLVEPAREKRGLLTCSSRG